MTLWEFRQWMESAVPMWVPFAIGAAGLVIAAVISAAGWVNERGDG